MPLKPILLSSHRIFVRNYSPAELLGEITNIIQSGDYEDFMFIAVGDNGSRAIRIGSKDRGLRIGDLLYLNQLIKENIMEI